MNEAAPIVTSEEDLHQTSAFGMWVFLISEVMLFGGLFFAFLTYRFLYSDEFFAAARHLKLWLAALNTIVLLSSSLAMAFAVLWSREPGQERKTSLALLSTVALGLLFIIIKLVEYYVEYEEHLFPWTNFTWSGQGAPQARLFFTFYFIMTSLHALHMVAGVSLLLTICYLFSRGLIKCGPVAISGLYWHFVDVVWVFLFALLYLNGHA